MKVGILTFPHSPSYGASLQMYALYKVIEAQGHEPYIINYQNKYMMTKQHMNCGFVKRKLLNVLSYRTKSKYKKFESVLKLAPLKTLSDSSILREQSEKLDFIVVGSDQVWNPDVTGKDETYFLDFCDDCKKVSYAASFGVDFLDDDFCEKISNLLMKIPSLSVREEKGAQIIKELIQRDVPIVVDPTFLHTKNFWENVSSEKSVVSGKYIFSFVFNPTKENSEFLKNISNETGLPIVRISDNFLKKSDKNNIYVSGVGPKEFIRLIVDAECIVTDSFHGTAFSILMNKRFYVTLSTKTNSRLETLLKAVGLEDRIIQDGSAKLSDIDYDSVNKKIIDLKQHSLNFLTEALSGEKNDEQK